MTDWSINHVDPIHDMLTIRGFGNILYAKGVYSRRIVFNKLICWQWKLYYFQEWYIDVTQSLSLFWKNLWPLYQKKHTSWVFGKLDHHNSFIIVPYAPTHGNGIAKDWWWQVVLRAREHVLLLFGHDYNQQQSVEGYALLSMMIMWCFFGRPLVCVSYVYVNKNLIS